MVKEDLRIAGAATLIIAVIDAYLLSRRILGEATFQPLFEFMVFYFPLILLVAYCVYLKLRLKTEEKGLT